MHPGKGKLRRQLIVVTLLASATVTGRAQSLEGRVESLVAAVSLDSLTRYVSQLSGAIPIRVSDRTLLIYSDTTGLRDSVWVADTLISLPNRFHEANEAAAVFLENKLRSFGYDSVVAEVYPELPFTRNVVAYKPGTQPSGPTWVICAHYDSVIRAPGADDNASGTAVVLEAARIFATTEATASIIFGLWDSEEAGLFGSDQYAAMAYDHGIRIDGVLNFDMVGWDGDGDRYLQIHADNQAEWIANYLADVAKRYYIGLKPDLKFPGTGRSDHVSFRNWGYPAVKIIEEEGDDFNPYYHSEEDVIARFNLGFFNETARLAVATLGQLTLSGTTVALEGDAPAPIETTPLTGVFPNPASDVLNMELAVSGDADTRLLITDLLGRRVATIPVGVESRVLRWLIPRELPNGVYFITLDSGPARRPKAFAVVR